MRSFILAFLLSLALPNPVVAQPCAPRLLPGTGIPGTDGTVLAAVEWDPDGAGPLPTVLVVGGQFQVAGSAFSPGVAVWDGADWHDMDGGLGAFNASVVQSLAVHNGELLAAGNFQLRLTPYAEVGAILRWTGAAWVSYVPPYSISNVMAMASLDQDLVVACQDTGNGSRIARWNGSGWVEMDTLPQVRALAIVDGTVYVGGMFNLPGGGGSIARWEVDHWAAVPGPNDPNVSRINYVSHLLAMNHTLYAAGYITNADGSEYLGLRVWNGLTSTDIPIADGVNFSFPMLSCMTAVDDRLYLGGSFLHIPTGHLVAILERVGSQWAAPPSLDVGNVMTAFRHRLVVNGVSVLEGDNWLRLGFGTDAGIDALTNYDGSLVAAGNFSTIQGALTTHLARLNPSGWHPIQTPSQFYLATARVLLVHQNHLVLGGSLSATVDGVETYGLLHFDGQSWHSYGSGPQLFPSVAASCSGNLYVLGTRYSNGYPSDHLVRWDGTSWSEVVPNAPLSITALTTINGRLIASGRVAAANVPPSGLFEPAFAFDGQTWSSLGAFHGVRVLDFPLAIDAIGSYGAEVLFNNRGNSLPGASFGTPASPLAAWNGATWRTIPVPGGFTPRAAAAVGQRLYASDGQSLRSFDGQTWATVATGLVSSGPLVAHGTCIVGAFSTRQSDGQISAYISRWTTRPSCAADFNCSGHLEVQDILDFIGAWFAGEAAADLDDNGLSVQDIFDLLNAWFAGC